MEYERHLYHVRTKGLRDFYVVARSWEDAANLLETELDKADYGYSDDRAVISIDLMSSEGFFSNGNRFINDDCRLLVQPLAHCTRP